MNKGIFLTVIEQLVTNSLCRHIHDLLAEDVAKRTVILVAVFFEERDDVVSDRTFESGHILEWTAAVH